MKKRIAHLPRQLLAAVTMLLLVGGAPASNRPVLRSLRRDRGSTLEWAILVGALATAAIALTVIIVNAINDHSANIR